MIKPIWLIAALLFFSSISFAQEICNDGLDNDGDGFIDCFDKKCASNALCDGSFTGNDASCEAKPSSFPKFSMTLDWGSPNGVTDHLSRVSIGDLDRDGFPEVVTLNSVSDSLFILDGRNGSIKKVLAPGYDVQRETAIANLDNDNCAEIFIYGYLNSNNASEGHYIFAYDCNFVEKWRRMIRGNVATNRGDPVHYGLADFNGDGQVELYCKDMILNAHTGAVLINSVTDWRYLNGGPVAVDILGDLDLELVIGCIIYKVDLVAGVLTELMRAPDYKTRTTPTVLYRHATSVADYNQDGFLDVIASGSFQTTDNTTAFFWDVKNNILKTFNDYIAGNVTIAGCNGSTDDYYAKGWDQGMGRINIADLDGDGQLNASYVSGKHLYALDENFNLLWRKDDIKEETSGITGCTLFDFNGDGKSEVVYRDEIYIYIINGVDGQTLTQQACVARTQLEYPIVADVDGDGSTELCVTCGFDDVKAQANFCSNTFYKYGHLRAFKSAAEPWVPARRLWNQHGYFNVNVNDDLTIPRRQQKHHLVWSNGSCTQGPNRPLNSFLNQSPFLNSDGCPTYAAPDLAYVSNSLRINPPTCPEQNFTVSFQITNLGDAIVNASLPISFYDGNPLAAGANKLNTIVIPLNNFKPGDIFSATNQSVTGPGTNFTLYGVINDAGTSVPTPIVLPNTNVLECNYDNVFSSPVTPLPFSITAEKINDNFNCLGSAAPNNGAVMAYRLVGAVKETAPYTFYWYNSTLPVSGAPAFTGSVYSGLPQGPYSVYAKHTAFQCSSDSVMVQVNQTGSSVAVQIVLNTPFTNCQTPNGELQAIVNGGAPVADFTYAWYEGNDIFTSPQIGVSNIVSGLKNLTYTVLVTSKANGCQSIESFNVPNNAVVPVISTTVTNIVCSNSNSGSASASIGGVTAGFTFKWYNGSAVKPLADFTGATYGNLVQGTYTVVATNNVTQCSATSSVTVTKTGGVTVTASKVSDVTSCDPLTPNGAASANVGGVTTGFSFEWFNGQNTVLANRIATTNSVTGLTQGTYTVKATDNATGCIDTEEITILNNIVIPILSATVIDVAHCTPLDGRVTANVSLDTPADYTFSWYNGTAVKATPDFPDTDNVLDNLTFGKYTVKATHNTRKCDAAAITVTVLDKTPTISITLVGSITVLPSDCATADGVMGVTVTAPGNTLGFDVQWFSGRAPFSAPAFKTETIPVTTIASGLRSGVYTVTALDRNSGCSSSQSFDLPFANSHAVNLVSKQDITTCIPGNDASITVKLLPTPLSGFTEQDYDINVYLGSNDTGAPIQVIPGVIGQANYSTTPTLSPGFYTFVAISKNVLTLGCKSVPLTVEILKNTTEPVLTTTILSSNTNCIGIIGNGQISLSIDGGASPLDYTIDWFEGATVSSPPLGTTVGVTSGINKETAQNLPAGKYTVRVTDASGASNGCFTITTFNIFDTPAIISILPSSDMTITALTRCDVSNGAATVNTVRENGVAVPLTNYTFQWFDATLAPLAGTGNTQINLAVGTYYISVRNTVNNCVTSSPIEFIIDNGTIGSIGVSLINFIEPTRCLQPANTLGTLEAAASGNSTTGYNYNWYSGTSASGPVQSTNPILSGLAIPLGLAEVIFTVQATNNSNQCTVVDTYHLPLDVIPVDITASAAPLTSCIPLNGIIFATVTSGNSNAYTYNWYNGNAVTAVPDFNGKQVTSLASGNYTVVAIDKVDAFCQSPVKTVNINDDRILPKPMAKQIAPVTNCDPARQNGVASASVNGDITHYTFDWFLGSIPAGTPIYTGAEITGLTDAIYTVVATDIVSKCTGTGSVTIQRNTLAVPTPQVTVVSDVTSCITNNGELSATVGGQTKDYIFYWYDGTAVKTTPDFVGDLYKNLTIGTYTVVAESRITGCLSGPASGAIKSKMVYPEFDFKIKPANCGQSNGEVEILITNNVEIERIEWDVNGTVVLGPILAGVPIGMYSVTITTKFGCTTTKVAEVKTEIRPFNGISRDKDGQNEIFYIDCIEQFPNNLVKIYNRAGTLIYQEAGYNNIDMYFDGKANRGVSPMGTNLPDGTYYYVIDKRDGSSLFAGYLEIVK